MSIRQKIEHVMGTDRAETREDRPEVPRQERMRDEVPGGGQDAPGTRPDVPRQPMPEAGVVGEGGPDDPYSGGVPREQGTTAAHQGTSVGYHDVAAGSQDNAAGGQGGPGHAPGGYPGAQVRDVQAGERGSAGQQAADAAGYPAGGMGQQGRDTVPGGHGSVHGSEGGRADQEAEGGVQSRHLEGDRGPLGDPDDARRDAGLPAAGGYGVEPTGTEPSPAGRVGAEGSRDAGVDQRDLREDPRRDAGLRDDDPTRDRGGEASGASERLGGPAAGGSTDGGQARLVPEDRAAEYRRRWESLKAGFVDEPRGAVRDANALVGEVLDEVENLFRRQRGELERHMTDDRASTEDLRLAMGRYRSFFDRLLSF